MGNLTNQYISQSFQHLAQVENGDLSNGLGEQIFTLSVTASHAVSASYATVASQLDGNATASYALTASYVENAQTASLATNALNADDAINAQTASLALNTLTASTASYVDIVGDNLTVNYNGAQIQITASLAPTVNTGSYLLSESFNAYTGSALSTFAGTATNAISASIARTASLALNALTASYMDGTLTVSNNVNNRILTATGTTALNGEASLIYDGITLIVTGGLSQGNANIATGLYSHAEGFTTTAAGQQSHAEGSSTLAFGISSHAEGETTVAVGISSHAEGDTTTAFGAVSHAEGSGSYTFGSGSHAEGAYTQAIGHYAHAEGSNTTALGDASHAEGLYTIASGSGQHVSGKFNEILTDEGAFIVGNGINVADRSNLLVASNDTVQITGSLDVTGSILLNGAPLSVSTSSFALTASYVENAQTASYVVSALTASYVENALTASYVDTALTASYVENAQTASYVENAQTASYYSGSTFNTLQEITNNGSNTDQRIGLYDAGNDGYNGIAGLSNGLRFTNYLDDPMFDMRDNGEFVVYDSFASQSVIARVPGSPSVALTLPQESGTILLYNQTGSYALTSSLANRALSATSASWSATASLAQQVSTSISTQNLEHNVLFVDTAGVQTAQVDGGLRYNPNTNLLTTTASFALTASMVLGAGLPQVYNREIHVSSGSGNDISGNGTLLSPYATVTKACSVVTGNGSVIVVHPGVYNESPTLSMPNVNVASVNTEGGITFINGTFTFSNTNGATSCRAVGIRFTNVTKTGAGLLYLTNCQVAGTFTNSGTGYAEIQSTDMQGTGINLSGTTSTTFAGGMQSLISVSASAATAVVKDSLSCAGVNVLLGTFASFNSVHYSLASGSAAITSAANTIVQLSNAGIYNPSGTVERIAISGFLGFSDTVFNRALSTVGTSLGITSFFQNINATGSLFGTASYAVNALTASYALTSAGGGAAFPFTGIAVITGSLNQGGQNILGPGVTIAHAAGRQTLVTADYAHTEGQQTTAGANYSHAEGQLTFAAGNWSHAEGNNNRTTGTHTHSEGSGNHSVGSTSHTEGISTIANGVGSHAEGTNTAANGANSHVEGLGSNSQGVGSHAEGEGCVSFGYASHAEGFQTTAVAPNSHTEGVTARAFGTGSHAEGFQTSTAGYVSHAEGFQTITLGTGSHAEGRLTTAKGDYSHAAGFGSITSASYQSVVGQYNIIDATPNTSVGYKPFVVGSSTNDLQRFNGFELQQFAVNGANAFHMTIVLPSYASMQFADDTAAAAGGIPLGGVYVHTPNQNLRVRVV